MRSSRNCRATISEISGSSRIRMRGSISTCVTRDPNLAKHWASSQPIGPPPRTTSRGGNALKVHTVSEVMQPASASPGIGGTKVRAPAAMTIARVVSARLPVSLHLHRPGRRDFRLAQQALDAELGVALGRVVRFDGSHHALHALHDVGENEVDLHGLEAEF